MTKRPAAAEATTFFVAAIALSIATSPISFTLGAFGEIANTNLLKIWVASVAALIANCVIGRTEDGEAYFTWLGSILLLVPSLLILSQILGLTKYSVLIDGLEWILLLGSTP